MKKALVTGAAGFIGSHTSHRLLDRGDEVVGLDNVNDYYDTTLKHDRLKRLAVYKNYHHNEFCIADEAKLTALFEQHTPDRVVHLAAQAGVRYSLTNPQAYISSNLVGFGNILECCRHFNTEHLVYASSSSVYGANKQQPFSTGHGVNHPVSLYAATKKSNELMAHSYSHLYDIPTTGLRFFTVYGPYGRPDMAYYLFTKAILEDKTIKVFNNGELSRDFTYVGDIVELVKRVLTSEPKLDRDKKYRLYNVGYNSPVNLLDFVETKICA